MNACEPQPFVSACIQKIATGPTMSKDLSATEAEEAMRLILTGQVDPVQSAVFLIALRMKRETQAENRGIYAALRAATQATVAPCDEIVDLAEPYDGFLRHLSMVPFLPSVLAACGVPSVVHGCSPLAPKFGVTIRQVLNAASVKVLDVAPARQIADAGWAYADLASFAPGLQQMLPLRALMVKRPCLSTLEKLLGPVRGQKKTHLVVGYVHRGYEDVLMDMASQGDFSSALVVKGIEGGVQPSLTRPSPIHQWRPSASRETTEVTSADLGVTSTEKAVPLPEGIRREAKAGERRAATVDRSSLAKATAAAGLAVLNGEPGVGRDALTYAVGLVLWHLKKVPELRDGVQMAAEAIDCGKAQTCFNAP